MDPFQRARVAMHNDPARSVSAEWRTEPDGAAVTIRCVLSDKSDPVSGARLDALSASVVLPTGVGPPARGHLITVTATAKQYRVADVDPEAVGGSWTLTLVDVGA